jgi:DNA (cytosine-5)-methyltransferase 1
VRIGSLFAGIGGLELGLERAGVGRTIWQVEQDEYCRKILARHWPGAARYDDVRTVGGYFARRNVLAPVDVICGGFPCQDLSYAGKGAGLSGARSGLWFEFARIVRELRPRFVVVENVPALLARGLGVVLGDLASCGYDAVWDCVSAAELGARHRRQRLFIVAYSVRDGSREQLAARTAFRRARETYHNQQTRQKGDIAATHMGAATRADRIDWSAEPDVGRVANGVPARVDRLRALGNAVVPQVAEMVGYVLLQIAAQHPPRA